MNATMDDVEHIRYEVRDGVAIIELHRPEHLNACTMKMLVELGNAYRTCDSDDTVRAVILTGAGKAFCAGADLSAGGHTFTTDRRSFLAAGGSAGVDPPAWEVRKPVIAAMNGHTVGIGLALALQCDIRIAALEGKYSAPQVRRGVIPDCYSIWTLPRTIGMERAADLLLTGRVISGSEAGEIGLASRVLPAAEVLPTAMEIARDIAISTSPISVAITKRLLWESPNLSRPELLRRETELQYHLFGKPDALEGPSAWLERRQPEWRSSVTRDWPDWPI